MPMTCLISGRAATCPIPTGAGPGHSTALALVCSQDAAESLWSRSVIVLQMPYIIPQKHQKTNLQGGRSYSQVVGDKMRLREVRQTTGVTQQRSGRRGIQTWVGFLWSLLSPLFHIISLYRAELPPRSLLALQACLCPGPRP